MTKRADIGSLGALHIQEIILIPSSGERKLMDHDVARRSLDLAALTGDFIQPSALDTDCRVHGWDLKLLTAKGREAGPDLLLSHIDGKVPDNVP